MTTKFGDVRDYIQRSSWRALQTLAEAVTFNQSVRRMTIAEERESLRADGFIAHDDRLTPRGETMGNFLRSNPDWRPEAPVRYEAVPNGWQLVPVEPTAEMIHVARFGEWGAERIVIGEPVVCGKTPFPSFGEEMAREVYRIMLASAPAPASGRVDSVAAIAKIIDPEGSKLLAEGKNLTTGQAANYRDAYGKAHLILASLSPAATPDLAMPSREWMRDKIAADPDIEDCGAVPVSSPAVRPEDLQLLDHLTRDNVLGGARPVVSGGEELAQAWRLSEDGMIALEQVARGVRLHITRRGIAALSARRVGE